VIARHWRGLARAHRAADYLQHLRTETLPALQGLAGFVDASVLSRPLADGVEFLVITRWASLEAIAGFSGGAVEVAVVPEAVAAMMIEYDRRARHFEVLG